jgi:hypothetical protein
MILNMNHDRGHVHGGDGGKPVVLIERGVWVSAVTGNNQAASDIYYATPRA